MGLYSEIRGVQAFVARKLQALAQVGTFVKRTLEEPGAWGKSKYV